MDLAPALMASILNQPRTWTRSVGTRNRSWENGVCPYFHLVPIFHFIFIPPIFIPPLFQLLPYPRPHTLDPVLGDEEPGREASERRTALVPKNGVCPYFCPFPIFAPESRNSSSRRNTPRTWTRSVGTRNRSWENGVCPYFLCHEKKNNVSGMKNGVCPYFLGPEKPMNCREAGIATWHDLRQPWVHWCSSVHCVPARPLPAMRPMFYKASLLLLRDPRLQTPGPARTTMTLSLCLTWIT